MSAPRGGRGRRAARWGFAAAVLIFLVLCYEQVDLVLERIYLRRLATGNGLEQRIAARQLVKLRSRRAVEVLVGLLRDEEGKMRQEDELTWVPRALFALGDQGIEAALSACHDEDDLKWLLRHGINAGSTDALELLPHLTRRLERKEHRDVLMEAIASLGGLDVALLVEKLEDPTLRQRVREISERLLLGRDDELP